MKPVGTFLLGLSLYAAAGGTPLAQKGSGGGGNQTTAAFFPGALPLL